MKVRTRVQSIVIQKGNVLFGYGKSIHFFPGGGLEDGETVEQGALRELREEAGVDGTILFRISEPAPPGVLKSAYHDHATFLVDIGDQMPCLGYDPEETDTVDEISLVGIELIPLDRIESFTSIDIDYFRLLVAECRRRRLDFPWLFQMNDLTNRWRQR